MATAEQIAVMPERGSYPRQLHDLGIKDYRQVFFKPIRLIYRVMGRDLVTFVIAEGRCDMHSLLTRRLLARSSTPLLHHILLLSPWDAPSFIWRQADPHREPSDFGPISSHAQDC